MSYDIKLLDRATGELIEFDEPHQMKGGNYAVNGTTEAWLNVTWNYAEWYYRDGVFPDSGDGHSGIRAIYGLTGAESIPVLKHAIGVLEPMDEPMSEDEIEAEAKELGGRYWVATKENALRPLYQLLAMAQMRPDGIWCGD